MKDLVREFHERFGLGVAAAPTARPAAWRLRIDLLREEFEEYVAAAERGDVVGVADALADMAYVIHGTALVYGIPLDRVVAEVHRSNMTKLGPDGRPVRREDGKVVKGPDYVAPDIARVLESPEQETAVPHQRLAAYALLLRDDAEVLLTRISSRGHNAGAWTLPGGGVEHGEDVRDALCREVQEETGLEIAVGELRDVHTVHFTGRAPSGRLEDFHGVHLIFDATVTSAQLGPRVVETDGSTDAAAWVRLGDVDRGTVRVLDVVRHALRTTP